MQMTTFCLKADRPIFTSTTPVFCVISTDTFIEIKNFHGTRKDFDFPRGGPSNRDNANIPI